MLVMIVLNYNYILLYNKNRKQIYKNETKVKNKYNLRFKSCKNIVLLCNKKKKIKKKIQKLIKIIKIKSIKLK